MGTVNKRIGQKYLCRMFGTTYKEDNKKMEWVVKKGEWSNKMPVSNLTIGKWKVLSKKRREYFPKSVTRRQPNREEKLLFSRQKQKQQTRTSGM